MEQKKCERKNGNHINMMSLKEICLFMVIIFSCCSLYANGKHVKSTVVTVMDLSKASATATTTTVASKAANEVNENSSDMLLKRTNDLPKTRRSANDDNEQNDDDDGYVMEDMNLMQQDQPYSPYHRHHPFQMQKDYSTQEKRNLPQQNWQLTNAVQIKQGHLKGVIRPMHPHTGLRNVHQYLGIPYAAAPIGNGRFMPPGTPQPWSGMKMATSFSSVCPQNLPSLNNSQQHFTSGRLNHMKRLMQFLQNESEDCLFLNLYVPEWSGIGPRPIYPVMVFIQGESYEWNSGNAYDGSVLSSYGQVIVVTLNYRLGILGFLQPGTSDTASNFGLLDQIAALKWVKDNIAAFGGDVGSVTLMGHSTGAACVNLLMLSPVAQGLFHRAILMSGSAMSDWAISNHPQQSLMEVLHQLDCPLRDDNEEMLTCLRSKPYQDIMKVHVTTPEFTTSFGPVVDNFIVPNEPEKMMQHFHGEFKRYDLLFGLTEIESFNSINAIGITHGLLDRERDDILRFYMQNRFEYRPDLATELTLREYSNIYTNPKKPQPGEHRDVVLEILSDARVAAPLLQTGIYHSRINPSTYMYLFSHISKAGDYPMLSQSIAGEELPYIFGAPLSAVRPFLSSFSPAERLLSEEMMVYWTNFAKTGNPKAPGRDHFLNLGTTDWMQYDIDWPSFTPNNSSYLNIGIPPVVSKNYRQQYMNFWNNVLNERLYGDPKKMPSSTDRGGAESTSFVKPLIPHVNYYLDKSTENPIRQLQYLLHNNVPNRSDMYATQSTIETPRAFDAVSASPENTFMLGDNNKIIVKADSTIHVLIAMIIIFLVINVIIITIYLVRRNYFKKNMKQKLDILSLDGTTDDDLKRSNKFDGDESFILDIVRRKNEYVPVKRYHSPINGFLLTRHYSTSTMDTHTKVSDWISHEVNQQSPHLRSKSPSFSFGTTNFLYGKRMDGGGANGIDNNNVNGSIERHPIELMKSKSFELNRKTGMISQELGNYGGPLFKQMAGSVIGVSPNHGNSMDATATNALQDPISSFQNVNEKVTSFIEDVDVNVTSRDECDGASHFRLTPEETLQIYQMRNYPKVLPVLPKHSNQSNSEYVSQSSFKRRSMPSYQHMINTYARAPPVPPPRTTSTLDRMMGGGGRRTEPLMPVMADPIPESPTEEPDKIEVAALHVGPLLPGSKENLYSTVNRRKYALDEKKPCIVAAQIEAPLPEAMMARKASVEKITDSIYNDDVDETDHIAQPPKSIMKRPISRQNSGDSTLQSGTQQLQTSSKIPVLSRLSTNAKSSSSNSSNSNTSDSKSNSTDPSTDNSAKELISELKRAEASIASLDTCSSAETAKQIF